MHLFKTRGRMRQPSSKLLWSSSIWVPRGYFWIWREWGKNTFSKTGSLKVVPKWCVELWEGQNNIELMSSLVGRVGTGCTDKNNPIRPHSILFFGLCWITIKSYCSQLFESACLCHFWPGFAVVCLFLGRFAVVVQFPPSDSVSVSWPLLVKLTLGVFCPSTVALCLCDSHIPSGALDPVCFQSPSVKLELLDSFCFTWEHL